MACVLILLGPGCGTVDPGPELDDVRGLVGDRATADVVWDRDDAARQAIDERVKQLLATELTPYTAVQIGLLRNRTLQAALAQIGIAQAELVQAGLLQNPVLSADVRFAVGASGTGADLALVQEFLSVLQIPLRRRVAKAELEATKLAVGAALFQFSTLVREAFHDVQGAGQTLDLQRTAAQAISLSADVAQRQHDAGNITDLDYASQQALYEEAKLALSAAAVDAFEKRESLTALLGLWGEETQWRIGACLPSIPPDDPKGKGLESLAVTKRLDLAEARQRAGAAAQSISLISFYGLLPEAGVGVASEREVEDGLWSLGPSIDLSLPVFDQRQARLAVAKEKRRQEEDNFAALAVSVRSEVRQAWTRLDGARSRALHYQSVILPLRRKILAETQREYNAMQIGVYQLLQAKREEIGAGRGYIETLRDYWLSRIALERAVGTELPFSTGPVPSPCLLEEESAPKPGGHEHHHGG